MNKMIDYDFCKSASLEFWHPEIYQRNYGNGDMCAPRMAQRGTIRDQNECCCSVEKSIKNNHIKCFEKKLHKMNNIENKNEREREKYKLLRTAVKKNNLEFVKYAVENECKWDYVTYACAAIHENIDCLKYLHEHSHMNVFPDDYNSFADEANQRFLRGPDRRNLNINYRNFNTIKNINALVFICALETKNHETFKYLVSIDDNNEMNLMIYPEMFAEPLKDKIEIYKKYFYILSIEIEIKHKPIVHTEKGEFNESWEEVE